MPRARTGAIGPAAPANEGADAKLHLKRDCQRCQRKKWGVPRKRGCVRRTRPDDPSSGVGGDQAEPARHGSDRVRGDDAARHDRLGRDRLLPGRSRRAGAARNRGCRRAGGLFPRLAPLGLAVHRAGAAGLQHVVGRPGRAGRRRLCGRISVYDYEWSASVVLVFFCIFMLPFIRAAVSTPCRNISNAGTIVGRGCASPR